jgi:hypothetical protein
MMEASNLTLATPSVNALLTVNAFWSLSVLVFVFVLVIFVKTWPYDTESMREAAHYVLRDRDEWAHALLLSFTPAFLMWTIMTLSSGFQDLMSTAAIVALIFVGLLVSVLGGLVALLVAAFFTKDKQAKQANS